MRIHLLSIVVLFSCHRVDEMHHGKSSLIVNDRYHQSIQPFSDSSYIFNIRAIDTSDSYNTEKPTVVVQLYHVSGESVDTIMTDSLFSRNDPLADPDVVLILADLNFDGQEDILIPAGTDPRSNLGYHLYLVSNNENKLTYVSGFRDIGNPEPDDLNKVIVSCVLSGQNFCNFYFLDKQMNLRELQSHVNFLLNESDSIRFERALAEAAKERATFY